MCVCAEYRTLQFTVTIGVSSQDEPEAAHRVRVH